MHGGRADIELVNKLTLVFDLEQDGFTGADLDGFHIKEIVFHDDLDGAGDVGGFARCADFGGNRTMALTVARARKCGQRCRRQRTDNRGRKGKTGKKIRFDVGHIMLLKIIVRMIAVAAQTRMRTALIPETGEQTTAFKTKTGLFSGARRLVAAICFNRNERTLRDPECSL